ncbi:hypothetical protein [Photobacterium leiognathi]|uniref:hypothetical protein n=1 Tax=Photobacterium leiognathi TaxID=553611 RepID=UPI002980CA2A|nr:hypothetical protein [Photobacterium leiognathi]
MTMIALALSPDFCIVAADKAVGRRTSNGKVVTQEKAVKINYSTNSPMPYVATAAGYSLAVDLVPEFASAHSIKTPADIVQLGIYLAKTMKQTIAHSEWVNEHTSTYMIAITEQNELFVRGFYLNDETVLLNGCNPTLSQVAAGFEEPQKSYWEHRLTTAMNPLYEVRTPLQRLNDALSVMREAFAVCASTDEYVSPEFDYCVITAADRRIAFNSTPFGSIFG